MALPWTLRSPKGTISERSHRSPGNWTLFLSLEFSFHDHQWQQDNQTQNAENRELGWRKGAGWGSGVFKLSYRLALLPPTPSILLFYFLNGWMIWAFLSHEILWPYCVFSTRDIDWTKDSFHSRYGFGDPFFFWMCWFYSNSIVKENM